jgi:molybdate transport system substrate-binding protein
MNSSRNIIVGSIVVIAVLVALLAWNSAPRRNKSGSNEALLLYCAAGLKLAVEPAVREYEEATGSRVQIQYAGSGTLLSNLKVAKLGDLYLSADRSFLDIAIRDGLVAETIPLAEMVPVIAVAKGYPKGL